MSLPLRAYPAQLIESHALGGGTWVTIRPARPEDEPMIAAFLGELSPASRYQRHFAYGVGPDLALLERLRGADYDHVLALVAVTMENDAEAAVGLAEYAAADGEGEFALVVADRWQGRGLGSRLLQGLRRCAEKAGLRELFGYTLSTNTGLIRLVLRHGYAVVRTGDATVLRVFRALERSAGGATGLVPPPDARAGRFGLAVGAA